MEIGADTEKTLSGLDSGKQKTHLYDMRSFPKQLLAICKPNFLSVMMLYDLFSAFIQKCASRRRHKSC
ncbi:hypothetical protein DPMN_121313 [Dreissena polymorpha]|uniref:Uncharacterized protein n=1 Tax=Dreissena polymorpha TaxID=45954 RepID=A0A9D4JQZ2_DREPO|nr:hypothetical protein DPMN_121313 [Dreissena polymorpha]